MVSGTKDSTKLEDLSVGHRKYPLGQVYFLLIFVAEASAMYAPGRPTQVAISRENLVTLQLNDPLPRKAQLRSTVVQGRKEVVDLNNTQLNGWKIKITKNAALEYVETHLPTVA